MGARAFRIARRRAAASIGLMAAWVLTACASTPGPSSSAAPQTVDIPSGTLHLKAFLWKPAGPAPFPAVVFNHGSGGATAGETAGLPTTEAAQRLAPVFVDHGYAFLYPFRRGQGLSADQAPFMREVLEQVRVAHGDEARQHRQFILLTTEQLDDVMASLAVLKATPGIDARRIAIAGQSFGGQLTLLAAGRDPSLRAAVAFAAAAASWARSAELRDRMLGAMRTTSAAVMLVQAENDYDVSPSRDLGDALERLGKPHLVRIYPPVGRTSDDGHNAVYEAVPLWRDEVLAFLDRYVKQ